MVIRLGARLSRNPARIIYVSQIGARQHAALGYRPEKEIVIPNGVDCQTFHPDAEARQWIRAELGIAPEQVLGRYASVYENFVLVVMQTAQPTRQLGNFVIW